MDSIASVSYGSYVSNRNKNSIYVIVSIHKEHIKEHISFLAGSLPPPLLRLAPVWQLPGLGHAGRSWGKKALTLLSLCLVFPLVTKQRALGQDFHPTMVETGLVNTDSHITFNPPFPNAPTVVLAVTRVLDATSGCSPTVKNVTNTGFDYVSNCTAGLKYPSTWIATLQQ
jgi:hypothetical protein